MSGLLTITAPATAELEEKGSRFIGHLVPYSAFDATLAALRQEHRKASHHVTAFRHVLGDSRIEEGARDDGEPAGTSGMPMLKVLTGSHLVDVGLVVVRYFGGTKLGAGGLARAYSGAAARCIAAATLVPWVRIARRTLSCPFGRVSECEQAAAALGLAVIERSFTETGCTFTLEGPEESLSRLPESAALDA